eukprot:INCI2524.2.p1 GENE.INCI2524.2~~INCI2524.2.p1  ORF type:complete len:826 (+),score=110.58 INCI2524.2:813-3290(+)
MTVTSSTGTDISLSSCAEAQTPPASLQLAATVWLKPNDIKAHIEVRNSILTVTKLKDNPRGEPSIRWAFGSAAGAAGAEATEGSRSLRDSVGVTPHFQRAVLNRANKFKAVVSFGFHTGYYGVQQYVVHPIVTDERAGNIPHPKATPEEVESVAAPFCPAYLSPVFEVLSCNRHPPRCPPKTTPAAAARSGAAAAASKPIAGAASTSVSTSRCTAKRPSASGNVPDPSSGASSAKNPTFAAPSCSNSHSHANPVRGVSSSTAGRKSRRRARDDDCTMTFQDSSCAIEDQAPADKIPRSPHRKLPCANRNLDVVPALNLATAATPAAPFAASPNGATLVRAPGIGVLQRGTTVGCRPTSRRRGSNESAAMSDKFSQLSFQGGLLRNDDSSRTKRLNGAGQALSPDDEVWLSHPLHRLQTISQPWIGAELGDHQHTPELHLKQEESNAIDNEALTHPIQWPMKLKKEEDYSWEEGNHQPNNSTTAYRSRGSRERGFHGQFGPSSVWDPFLASQPLDSRSSRSQRRPSKYHRHHGHSAGRGTSAGKRERRNHKSRPGSTAVGPVPRMRFCPEGEWMRDRDAKQCCNRDCDATFGFLVRRHHCRCCGMIFCASCCPKQSIPADVAAEAVAASSSSEAALSPQASSLPQRVRICHHCFDSYAAGRPPAGAGKVHSLPSGTDLPIGPILTDASFSNMHHGDFDDDDAAFMEGLSCEDGALLSVPGRAMSLEEPFYSASDVGCSSLDQLQVSRTRVSSGASGGVSDFTEDDELRQDFDEQLLCGKGPAHSPESWGHIPAGAGLEPCPDLFDEDKFAAQGRPVPHLADGRCVL